MLHIKDFLCDVHTVIMETLDTFGGDSRTSVFNICAIASLAGSLVEQL